jgi:hypothetical protein
VYLLHSIFVILDFRNLNLVLSRAVFINFISVPYSTLVSVIPLSFI